MDGDDADGSCAGAPVPSHPLLTGDPTHGVNELKGSEKC